MRLQTHPALSHRLLFCLLFSLFLLCFVLTPLWNVLPGWPLKALGLAMTLASGFLWAGWGSGVLGAAPSSLRLLSRSQAYWFLGIVFLVSALNFRALTSSIAWKGDEDFHILFARHLAQLLPFHSIYLAILMGFLAFGWAYRGKLHRVFAVAGLFGLLTAYAGSVAHLDIYHVLRYPIFLKYLTAFLVYLYSFLPLGHLPEIPYRILPLLSCAGLAWLGFHFLSRHALPIRILAALAVATLPVVHYYATLFYLEMPAVLCMTWVCFQAKSLLHANLPTLVKQPAWYALLLIGFIKESTLPFLVAFLLCRMLFHFIPRLRSGGFWKVFSQEAIVSFCIGFPLFLYLIYRLKYSNSRSYHPDISGLLELRFLILELGSWWDSFGLLLPLATVGALVLVVRRKWTSLLFPSLAFLLVFAFHFLDGGFYIGYSRFNLFLLPPLLALAWEALRFGASRLPAYTLGTLALIVGSSLVLSPIHFDGSRQPHWGVYALDVGEHSYPYRQALAYLKQNHAGKKTRLTGLYFTYSVDFYLAPKEMPEITLVEKPADESALMDSLLAASELDKFDVVLYHVLGDTIPAPNNLHGYGMEKIFRNQAHVLVLFSHPHSPH